MTPKRPQLLLTGLPHSYLAHRLLKQLLQEGEHHVLCLVPQNFEKPTRELLASIPREQKEHAELVLGDVSAMDFGLAGKEFLELAARVDSIYHCPQVTHAGVDRSVAETLNVRGAEEVLELAEASSGLSRLVFFSSASVSGKREGHILESELVKAGHRNPIEETLFRAETMMREAMGQVPITVLRPSIIVGDSTSGEIDRLEGPYLLILLMLNAPVDLRVPLPGRGDVPLNLVPIDYVVRATFAITRDPRSIGRTFHLVDHHPLSARRVFELIADEVGRPGPVGSLPTQVATALLRTPGLERFSHIPRAFLEQLATNVDYDERNTRELLAGTGIQCPPASTYLKVMVDHVRSQQKNHADAAKHQRSEREPRRGEGTEDSLEPSAP